jgi:hypothetical protein
MYERVSETGKLRIYYSPISQARVNFQGVRNFYYFKMAQAKLLLKLWWTPILCKEAIFFMLSVIINLK